MDQMHVWRLCFGGLCRVCDAKSQTVMRFRAISRYLSDRPQPDDMAKIAEKLGFSWDFLERAMRFELTTPTLARLCSTPELRPLTCARDARWMMGT